MKTDIRYPAVAEEFYPASEHELGELLESFLPTDREPLPGPCPRALLVPHPGYRYGGVVSAEAYRTVAGREFRTVVILGNAHSYLFDGIAIDTHTAWRTPIGDVVLDRDTAGRLVASAPGLIRELDIAHHCEHSLEVQLPFLQHVLRPGFRILPVLFGENSPEAYRMAAGHLIPVLGENDLLVVSSDLSHYPSYRDAKILDRKTLDHIVSLDIEGLRAQEESVLTRSTPGAISACCSPDAVKTLIEIACREGWTPRELAYRNSGDADHDDRNAVVGYGAVAFYASASS